MFDGIECRIAAVAAAEQRRDDAVILLQQFNRAAAGAFARTAHPGSSVSEGGRHMRRRVRL